MLGVFAPAPTSMATLPLVGGVPLTLATITTAIYVVSYIMMDPVAGGLGAFSCLYSTSGLTSWWQREPPWQDCLFGKQFLPSMLPPGLHSSLVTASLKGGHLHFLTPGIRPSSPLPSLFSWRCYSSLAIGTPFTENA